jgi:hypothetical protein
VRKGARITVIYESVDGVRKRKTFSDIARASKWAQEMVGADADIDSGYYAVDAYGVGKVTVEGATLADLWPQRAVRNVGERNLLTPKEYLKEFLKAVKLKPSEIDAQHDSSFEVTFDMDFGHIQVQGFDSDTGGPPTHAYVTTPDGGGGNTRYNDPKAAAKEVYRQIDRLQKLDKAALKAETDSLLKALTKAGRAYKRAYDGTSTEGFDEWGEHDRNKDDRSLHFNPKGRDKRFWDTVLMMPQARGKGRERSLKAGGVEMQIYSQGSYGGYIIVWYPKGRVPSDERRSKGPAAWAFRKEMLSSGWWNR